MVRENKGKPPSRRAFPNDPVVRVLPPRISLLKYTAIVGITDEKLVLNVPQTLQFKSQLTT